MPPDREFDRQWALHVLRLATEALANEWQAAGKTELFAALQPFIGGELGHGDLAALAEHLAENPATLRKTLSRMRHRFRQHVKAQLVPTLAESGEVEDENAGAARGAGGVTTVRIELNPLAYLVPLTLVMPSLTGGQLREITIAPRLPSRWQRLK